MTLISVIIPFFNVGKHLTKCLNSILQQNFADWEIILVDDGSTDDSGYIADEFAKKESRIKVFHKENGGVSSARNYGIEKANGKWLTFIDSDDFISQKFFLTFVQRSELENFDMFMADVNQIGIGDRAFVEYYLSDNTVSVRDAISTHKILRSGDLHGKLFKRDIVNKYRLSFCEQINYSEDRLFFDQYLLYCDKIALSSCVLYNYQRNGDGLSFKLNSFESEYLCYHELKSALSRLAEKNNLSLFDLLHDNPMWRTVNSLVNEKKQGEFKDWLTNIDEIDYVFLCRMLKNGFRYGNIFQLFVEKHQFRILYFCLKIYTGLKQWKQMLKK